MSTNFSGFLHHYVQVKLANSSMRVNFELCNSEVSKVDCVRGRGKVKSASYTLDEQPQVDKQPAGVPNLASLKPMSRM